MLSTTYDINRWSESKKRTECFMVPQTIKDVVVEDIGIFHVLIHSHVEYDDTAYTPEQCYLLMDEVVNLVFLEPKFALTEPTELQDDKSLDDHVSACIVRGKVRVFYATQAEVEYIRKSCQLHGLKRTFDSECTRIAPAQDVIWMLGHSEWQERHLLNFCAKIGQAIAQLNRSKDRHLDLSSYAINDKLPEPQLLYREEETTKKNKNKSKRLGMSRAPARDTHTGSVRSRSATPRNAQPSYKANLHRITEATLTAIYPKQKRGRKPKEKPDIQKRSPSVGRSRSHSPSDTDETESTTSDTHREVPTDDVQREPTTIGSPLELMPSLSSDSETDHDSEMETESSLQHQLEIKMESLGHSPTNTTITTSTTITTGRSRSRSRSSSRTSSGTTSPSRTSSTISTSDSGTTIPSRDSDSDTNGSTAITAITTTTTTSPRKDDQDMAVVVYEDAKHDDAKATDRQLTSNTQDSGTLAIMDGYEERSLAVQYHLVEAAAIMAQERGDTDCEILKVPGTRVMFTVTNASMLANIRQQIGRLQMLERDSVWYNNLHQLDQEFPGAWDACMSTHTKCIKATQNELQTMHKTGFPRYETVERKRLVIMIDMSDVPNLLQHVNLFQEALEMSLTVARIHEKRAKQAEAQLKLHLDRAANGLDPSVGRRDVFCGVDDSVVSMSTGWSDSSDDDDDDHKDPRKQKHKRKQVRIGSLTKREKPFRPVALSIDYTKDDQSDDAFSTPTKHKQQNKRPAHYLEPNNYANSDAIDDDHDGHDPKLDQRLSKRVKMTTTGYEYEPFDTSSLSLRSTDAQHISSSACRDLFDEPWSMTRRDPLPKDQDDEWRLDIAGSTL